MSKIYKKNQQLAKELQKRKSSKRGSVEAPVVEIKTQTEPKKRGRKRKAEAARPKKKKLYGIIEKMNDSGKFSFDYLIGRSVKILNEYDDRYEAVIRHPGYEGVIFSFLKDEISIIENKQAKKMKEFFE
jgi:hypothetical protein